MSKIKTAYDRFSAKSDLKSHSSASKITIKKQTAGNNIIRTSNNRVSLQSSINKRPDMEHHRKLVTLEENPTQEAVVTEVEKPKAKKR